MGCGRGRHRPAAHQRGWPKASFRRGLTDCHAIHALAADAGASCDASSGPHDDPDVRALGDEVVANLVVALETRAIRLAPDGWHMGLSVQNTRIETSV